MDGYFFPNTHHISTDPHLMTPTPNRNTVNQLFVVLESPDALSFKKSAEDSSI
jgi:hypothetical protein